MSEEEFLRRDVKNAVSNTVRTLLRTREFSKNFLGRKDSKEVDNQIDSISGGITNIIIQKLNSENLLGKDLTEEKFSPLYKLVLKEYFGGMSDRGRIRSKRRQSHS